MASIHLQTNGGFPTVLEIGAFAQHYDFVYHDTFLPVKRCVFENLTCSTPGKPHLSSSVDGVALQTPGGFPRVLRIGAVAQRHDIFQETLYDHYFSHETR